MIHWRLLALVILVVVALPMPAQARGSGHGSHGHHHPRHHVRHFSGFFPAYLYGLPNCWWEEGQRVNQLYVDKFGNSSSVPQWLPGQWVCWY